MDGCGGGHIEQHLCEGVGKARGGLELQAARQMVINQPEAMAAAGEVIPGPGTPRRVMLRGPPPPQEPGSASARSWSRPTCCRSGLSRARIWQP